MTSSRFAWVTLKEVLRCPVCKAPMISEVKRLGFLNMNCFTLSRRQPADSLRPGSLKADQEEPVAGVFGERNDSCQACRFERVYEVLNAHKERSKRERALRESSAAHQAHLAMVKDSPMHQHELASSSADWEIPEYGGIIRLEDLQRAARYFRYHQRDLELFIGWPRPVRAFFAVLRELW